MISLALILVPLLFAVTPFTDHNRTAYYWGQNSAGASGRGSQGPLRDYCTDEADILVLSFLIQYGNNREFALNFANACETTFSGSTLLHCPTIAEDIKYCQTKGKHIILSMGGAVGSYGFSGDADARATAQKIKDTFGSGSTDQRPFDDAIVDGYDLDIEGGSSQGYAAFIDEIRSIEPGVIITGAPQCLYPDAYLGDSLNKSWYDYVFVQFYNNWCNPGPNFNYDEWDKWATTISKNKDVRLFFGTPGSAGAAGSGYQGASNLKTYVDQCKAYDSFGGIMMWDASQAWANTEGGGYAKYAKSIL